LVQEHKVESAQGKRASFPLIISPHFLNFHLIYVSIDPYV
jgi:hypothetical protein